MMVASKHAYLNKEGVRISVLARTGTRVRNLDIELSPDGVVLLGETTSYYVKQLAQHGVLERFPDVQLHNRIAVRELSASNPTPSETPSQLKAVHADDNAEAA
jgi:hypothetical protein